MKNRELDKAKPYDEIGGEIRVGDVLRVEKFAPPFALMRVVSINRKNAGKEGEPELEADIQMVPVQIGLHMGKLHQGFVRVIDPEAERRAQEVLDRTEPKPREVLSFGVGAGRKQ